ncbi:type II toxin-antitoxin system RelE/ParE family toxin [Butyrivibrio sp. INlla14]|uniref:type II toxin-antitoxin system RelE/ParE family toxin n=1 Tax=Butyrivibrio sp. INlla14 TaxID=1520808 RepID=UPI000876A86D|nr:type II toxin-antitoxin system RelE/ParE family toxin [Butyrivibrio sp. INlla14]SCY13585.1 ParE toxin of type II toxin-antitoxin system, parDE [Butyrivibrio sp. INlla14]
MDKYTVDISPEAREILFMWVDTCEADNAPEVANNLIDSYESMLDTLEKNPEAGTGRLEDLPKKYRAYHIWRHLWAVYQTYYDSKVIKIEYIVDDRQDYKRFVK